MTLPDERYRALKCGKEFLYELIDPKKTPRVPKDVRRKALWVLRHYPDNYHLELIAERLPEWFDTKPFSSLHLIVDNKVKSNGTTKPEPPDAA